MTKKTVSVMRTKSKTIRRAAVKSSCVMIKKETTSECKNSKTLLKH